MEFKVGDMVKVLRSDGINDTQRFYDKKFIGKICKITYLNVGYDFPWTVDYQGETRDFSSKALQLVKNIK